MKQSRIILTVILFVTLAIIVTGTAVAVADVVTDSIGDSVHVHPYTMDDGNGTCVPWEEPSTGIATRNCDPINLVFPDQSVEDVEAALLDRDWTTSGLGSNQDLHFDDETLFLRQDIQLYFRESSSLRYHLRLWQDPNAVQTVGAVHHEAGRWIHTIDMSWDEAEAFVADQLCGQGYTCELSNRLSNQLDIQDRGVDDDSAATWRGWDNDGQARVIRVEGGGEPPPPAPAESLEAAVSVGAGPYSNRDRVQITVEVTDGTNPVPGAAVNVVVTAASGKMWQADGLTNQGGTVNFSYRVNTKRGGTGTYSVTASASKDGLEASDTASFIVQ